MARYRDLCSELLAALEAGTSPSENVDLKQRATAALALPPAAMPTDCQIIDAQAAAGICDPNWCDRISGDAPGRLQQLRAWAYALIEAHTDD